LASIEAEIGKASAKLSNPNFVERANPTIVQQERDRLTAWEEKKAKLEERRRLFGG
jgi:valyl-tRNA synthetase